MRFCVSSYEVYNNQLFDLLGDHLGDAGTDRCERLCPRRPLDLRTERRRTPLSLRESDSTVVVEGLRQVRTLHANRCAMLAYTT